MRKITAAEFRLSARMAAIEGEFKETRPGLGNIRSLLMEIDVQFRVWRDRYSQIGADMDMENLIGNPPQGSEACQVQPVPDDSAANPCRGRSPR